PPVYSYFIHLISHPTTHSEDSSSPSYSYLLPGRWEAGKELTNIPIGSSCRIKHRSHLLLRVLFKKSFHGFFPAGGSCIHRISRCPKLLSRRTLCFSPHPLGNHRHHKPLGRHNIGVLVKVSVV